MDKREFQKLKSLWYATGRQDAGNVMDPRELKGALKTSTPSQKQIKAWLLRESFDDWVKQADLDPSLTEAQVSEIIDAWTNGWSEYAAAWMKNAHEEDEEERRPYP